MSFKNYIKYFLCYFVFSTRFLFIESMQYDSQVKEIDNKDLKVIYPSGKEIKLSRDVILESAILEKYLNFLEDNSICENNFDHLSDVDLEIDLSSINLSNYSDFLNDKISDTSFDKFFNLIKSFKSDKSINTNIQSIFSNLINSNLDLKSRLAVVNLVEFLAVEKLMVPIAGALSYIVSKYDSLKEFRCSENFFNSIVLLQAPYIKKLSGIALIRLEDFEKSRLQKILFKLIDQNPIERYIHTPKVQAFSEDNLLFLSNNKNQINILKLDKNDKLELIDVLNFNSKIKSITFNSDHSLMVVALKNCTLSIFKKVNKNFVKILKNKQHRVFDSFNSLKISNDNKNLIALSDTGLYVFDLNTGDISLILDLYNLYGDLKKNSINKLSPFLDFIQDNQIIVTNNSGKIFLINGILNSNNSYSDYIKNSDLSINEFETNIENIECCALSPNKRILAIYANDINNETHNVYLYDLVYKKIIHEFETKSKISKLSFSPIGTEFGYLLGLGTNGKIFLLDLYTKQIILDLNIKKRRINSFVVCNKNSEIILTLSNGLIKKVTFKDFRDFIFENDYFFEQILLLLSIFNKEKFRLNLEKDHIKKLFASLPSKLKEAI